MHPLHDQFFYWLAFSPDSNALAVATSSFESESEIELRILDSNFGFQRFRSSFLPDSQDQQIQCIVYSPCASAVALSGDFGIYIQNVFSGELHRLCVGHHVGVVVYTPCGGSLAIEWEGGVRIIDVHSGAVAHEFQLKDSGFEIVSLSYVVTADTVRGTD
jgi:WD40 repeat protein